MAERLSEWAKRKRIHPKTAYKMYVEGRMPVPTERFSERVILVHDPDFVSGSMCLPERVAVYARVSSHDQKDDLARQISRVTITAIKRGYSIDEIVSEIGSGLNDNRPKLNALLADKTITTIVVEHQDRLSRFGVSMIRSLLSAQDRNLIVLDETEIEDDLVRDMTDLLTSYCARLYGKRSAVNRAKRAMDAAQEGTV